MDGEGATDALALLPVRLSPNCSARELRRRLLSPIFILLRLAGGIMSSSTRA
jgi:hypothetical protein